jgi:hypothetical protein
MTNIAPAIAVSIPPIPDRFLDRVRFEGLMTSGSR